MLNYAGQYKKTGKLSKTFSDSESIWFISEKRTVFRHVQL